MDIYTKAFKALHQADIDYVCIGAFAVNYYAKLGGQIITTQDCDIWIRPTWEQWRKSLQLLKKLGFAFEAGIGAEPIDILDEILIRRVFNHRSVVRAFRKEGEEIDLILENAGFDFDRVYRTHKVFFIEKIPVKVGKLEYLIEGKRLANRPKDKIFLEMYREILKDMLSKKKKK